MTEDAPGTVEAARKPTSHVAAARPRYPMDSRVGCFAAPCSIDSGRQSVGTGLPERENEIAFAERFPCDCVIMLPRGSLQRRPKVRCCCPGSPKRARDLPAVGILRPSYTALCRLGIACQSACNAFEAPVRREGVKLDRRLTL